MFDGMDVVERGPISPKRPPTETAGLADVFPYYAGFSFEWACTQLQGSDIRAGGPKVVLDPWNGSGTTTLAAQYDGHRAIGIDLNPAANVVARLRCHVSGNAGKAKKPRRYVKSPDYGSDPLRNWFTPESVERLRDWTRSFSRYSVNTSSLGYVAVFRVVRQLTKSFGGSNPTWVRKAKEPGDLVDIAHDALDGLIETEQEVLLSRLKRAPKNLPSALIVTASSANVPLPDACVDQILTSPPYLTRIDYAVAYSRELAVLGIDVSVDRTLRAGLMGTTLIRPSDRAKKAYGSTASALISDVSAHSSKASSGYYLKQAEQYLDDLIDGFDELTRVSKPGAEMCLVVQDSYYKDVHVQLADICIDEAQLRGWELVSRRAWPVTRTLTSLNRSAREYQKGAVAETVISLQKS